MKLTFTESAWKDYVWFQENDRKLVARINKLIVETLRAPLKADLSGYWSRRINAEHRLVYGVKRDNLIIIACRYHYGK